MTGKYLPLEDSLRKVPPEKNEVTYSFEQVEGIIQNKLPISARLLPIWWKNDWYRAHSYAWMKAGWMVEKVSQAQKWVRYVRMK